MIKSFTRLTLVFTLSLCIGAAWGSEPLTPDSTNSRKSKKEKKKEKKEEKIKQGWSFSGFPFLTFDSDLGLQIGALANLYDYGDGSRYPMYDHSLYVEASWFTKGSGIFSFRYDSDRLIKGIRTSLDITYIPDQAYHFFGYNGYEAIYNKPWVTEGDEAYKTTLFYRYKREFFRFKVDLQGKITDRRFQWLAGFDFYNIWTASIDRDRFDIADSVPVLFDQYKAWGIIPESEWNGGRFTVFKGGLVYDSRDNEPNPGRGIWTEVILAGAPKFTSNMEQGFLKLAITHRQYFTLVKKKLTFAYRLAYQGTIAGYTPSYAQVLMYYARMTGAYNEGLGGGRTLRGVIRNRVIGDGWVMGNFEFRWRFYNFVLANQNWYLALSANFDSGRVVQFIDVESKTEDITYPPGESKEDYFNFGNEGFHNAAGAGFYIGWNENFIVRVNYAMAFDEQDGNSGLYIGLNFVF
jgi:hypothetical protein